MNHPVRFAGGWLLVAAAALLTGCGKSSPTAPDSEVAPVQQFVRQAVVLFDKIHVTNDGDFIGSGEFEFKTSVNRESKLVSATLDSGDDLTLHQNEYIDGDGTKFTVTFEASEWDTDILGNNFRDPDMDKRSASKTFYVSPDIRGSYSMTLGNSACKVKLYYTVITQLKPANQ